MFLLEVFVIRLSTSLVWHFVFVSVTAMVRVSPPAWRSLNSFYAKKTSKANMVWSVVQHKS